MADPAGDPPDGGGHHPDCQGLLADVPAWPGVCQGDLLPLHGEGE